MPGFAQAKSRARASYIQKNGVLKAVSVASPAQQQAQKDFFAKANHDKFASSVGSFFKDVVKPPQPLPVEEPTIVEKVVERVKTARQEYYSRPPAPTPPSKPLPVPPVVHKQPEVELKPPPIYRPPPPLRHPKPPIFIPEIRPAPSKPTRTITDTITDTIAETVTGFRQSKAPPPTRPVINFEYKPDTTAEDNLQTTINENNFNGVYNDLDDKLNKVSSTNNKNYRVAIILIVILLIYKFK